MAILSRLIIAALILTISQTHTALASQEELNKAWEYFKNNKNEEAWKSFESAAQNPDTRSEALLMLSIMASTQEKNSETFRYLSEFIKAEKNPAPYIYSYWGSNILVSGPSKNEEKLEFLENLVNQEGTNETIRAIAYDALGRYYEGINDFDEADVYWSKIGAIDNWQMVGTFDNISGSGFDKDWEPLAHPESDYKFTNHLGAKVWWFEPTGKRPGRWINYYYHFSFSNTIIFAQTFCKSPVEQEVQLRFGVSGSVKVWLNDNLVFSESDERNCGEDAYIQPVRLNKGTNRILIQIGESEANASNFLMRITDNNGRNIEGLEYTTTYDAAKGAYTKASGTPAAPIENFSEKFFQEKIKESPDKLINYILLAEAYLMHDMKFEARKTINKALELAPICSYLHRQLINVYIRENNRTELSLTIEKIKKNDPENLFALEILFQEEMDKENYTEARKILNKIKKYEQNSIGVYSKEINLAAVENKNEELVRLTLEAYEAHPSCYEFVNIMLYIEVKGNKNVSKGIKILENYLEQEFNADAYESLAGLRFENEQVQEGMDCLFDIVNRIPLSDETYESIGKIHFDMRNYEKAVEYFNNCIQIAPYVGNYWSLLAQAYSEMGNIDKAKSAYTKALEYNPFDYETMRKYRKMLDKKDVFDYFANPDYYKLFEAAPDAKAFPEDNSLMVLDETQKVVYKNGGSEEKNILLVKIFNESGIDRWKERQLSSPGGEFEVEKAEVLKKDGNRLKAEISDDMVVFPSLQAGDGILLIYKVKNYQYGKLTKHFWDRHYFSHFYPYQKSKYSLLIDPSVKFDYKMLNSTLEPQKTEHGEFNLYVWENNDKPSIKNESLRPALSDIAEVLHISTIKDWDFISKWYSDISKTKARGDFEVKETVTNLFKDKGNLTDEQKVRAIYEYIVKNIRYSYVPFLQSGIVPQKASRVINTRMGDCKDVSTLFVAMCKESGIDAKLVLVSTRRNGKNDLPLPSTEFDHCIAKLKLNGQDYYVELTSDLNPFSTIGTSLFDAFSLDIEEKATVSPTFINPSTAVVNSTTRETVVTFDGPNMKVEKKNIKTGYSAADMREGYKNKGKEAQEKSMVAAIASEFPNIKLLNLTFDESLDNLSDSMTYKYSYAVSNVFTKISDMYIMKMPLSEAMEMPAFLSHEKRVLPMELFYYDWDKFSHETLIINIPPDKKLVELPQTVKLSCDAADYSMEYKVEGNKLIAVRKMVYKQPTVPASKYDELKKFFEGVVTSDKTQLPFRDASAVTTPATPTKKLGKK